MQSELILPAAGLLAGAMNAVAGGGSFVTFPALVLSGVPSVAANASSTVALFPGAFSSAWAFREDFRTLHGVPVRALLPVSTAGGLAGALLLLQHRHHRRLSCAPGIEKRPRPAGQAG